MRHVGLSASAELHVNKDAWCYIDLNWSRKAKF